MKIKPLGDRLLIDPIGTTEEEKDGIVIPDSAKKKPREGKVIEVGTGRLDDAGKRIPPCVKKGDHILLPKHGGIDVKIGDKMYQIVNEEDILGVIADSKKEAK